MRRAVIRPRAGRRAAVGRTGRAVQPLAEWKALYRATRGHTIAHHVTAGARAVRIDGQARTRGATRRHRWARRALRGAGSLRREAPGQPEGRGRGIRPARGRRADSGSQERGNDLCPSLRSAEQNQTEDHHRDLNVSFQRSLLWISREDTIGLGVIAEPEHPDRNRRESRPCRHQGLDRRRAVPGHRNLQRGLVAASTGIGVRAKRRRRLSSEIEKRCGCSDVEARIGRRRSSKPERGAPRAASRTWLYRKGMISSR
jgi:hypothetical protein